MGSTGDPPVPSGDPPDGTERCTAKDSWPTVSPLTPALSGQ